MPEPVQPTPMFTPRSVNTGPNKTALLVAAIGISIIVAVVLAYLYATSWSKSTIGVRCKANADCRTNLCLPDESVERVTIDGYELPSSAPPTVDPSGTCTRYCTGDADCPATMTCGATSLYTTQGAFTTRESRSACVPRVPHREQRSK
jgi:hypothetical protein